MDSQIHYLPLTPGLFSILVFLVVGLIILIQLRILRYAYMRLGVGPGVALLLLFGSLIGSYFNIPITVLPGHPVRSDEIVDFFGMSYVVPLVTSWPGTVIAVNIGGAVIPTIMSIYLVIRYQLWIKAALAVAVIAFVIHSMATPVPGHRHCRARLRTCRNHCDPGLHPFSRIRPTPCLYRRLDGNIDRRRSSQSRQDRRPWRSGRLDRRRRNVRRHIPHRYSRRAAGRPCRSFTPTTGVVSAANGRPAILSSWPSCHPLRLSIIRNEKLRGTAILIDRPAG